MKNLSSYCESIDAKVRASDKDLPVVVCYMPRDAHTGISSLHKMGKDECTEINFLLYGGVDL